jgi:uncharacterized protein
MIAKVRLAKAFADVARMALIALALVAVAGPAQAQQKPEPEPSASAVAMAREIIDLKGSVALFAPVVAGVIERVRTLLLQTNPALRKDLDEVSAMLRKQFEPRTADLLNQFSKFYASTFTEPELKQILAFYRSPTGKKVIAIEPGLLQEAVAGLKDWQEDFAEEVLPRFRAEMKKRGHNL